MQIHTITDLLQADAAVIPTESLQDNQQKDPDLLELIQYMEEGTLYPQANNYVH